MKVSLLLYYYILTDQPVQVQTNNKCYLKEQWLLELLQRINIIHVIVYPRLLDTFDFLFSCT